MPGIIVNGAYILNGDINRTTSLWVQHWAATQPSQLTTDTYAPTPFVYNSPWSVIYESVINNCNQMIDRSDNQANYKGVALVLRSYFFAVLADLYNDIPYNDAAKGTSGILHPAFDNQLSVYDQLITDLETATALLDPNGTPISSTADLVYSGNIRSWLKLANTLKFKFYMRLSAVAPAKAQAGVAALFSSSAPMLSNAGEDAVVRFLNQTQNQHPLYQQYTYSNIDYGASSTLANLMTSLGDTLRLKVYFTTYNNKVSSIRNGEGAGNKLVSQLGSSFRKADGPAFLFTYMEKLFLEAEANERGYINTGTKKQLYNNAVNASFQKLGIALGNYVSTGSPAAFPTSGDTTDELKALMTQKYIALFCQGYEVYCDWRRTNLPDVLVPAANNVNNDKVPARFPYSVEEQNNNPNTPAATLNDKVRWDVD